jgi:hypothetical protein
VPSSVALAIPAAAPTAAAPAAPAAPATIVAASAAFVVVSVLKPRHLHDGSLARPGLVPVRAQLVERGVAVRVECVKSKL